MPDGWGTEGEMMDNKPPFRFTDPQEIIDRMNKREQEMGDTTKCKTCIIAQYEIPEMWCKDGCVKTDLIPIKKTSTGTEWLEDHVR